jgi:hypothetical protein
LAPERKRLRAAIRIQSGPGKVMLYSFKEMVTERCVARLKRK